MLSETNSPEQSLTTSVDIASENMVEAHPIPANAETAAGKPVDTIPPIASLWCRWAASFVDVIILGVLGQILGLIFSSLLFQIGPLGRLIGLVFILPYYGLLNSKFGGGQTLGKRLLKIAVRSVDNQPIGLDRSLLRIFILELPILLNGWALPIFQNKFALLIQSIIVFGLGVVTFYTMVFNWKARQGIHDLICKTYVVHLPGKPIEHFPLTSRVHWIISGVLGGLVIVASIVMVILSPKIYAIPSIAASKSLYDILNADQRFLTASVGDRTVNSQMQTLNLKEQTYNQQNKSIHFLDIIVQYKGLIKNIDNEELFNDIARIALENHSEIDSFDNIRITIRSAYDIGIASVNLSHSMAGTIDEWRKRINPLNSNSAFSGFQKENYSLFVSAVVNLFEAEHTGYRWRITSD